MSLKRIIFFSTLLLASISLAHNPTLEKSKTLLAEVHVDHIGKSIKHLSSLNVDIAGVDIHNKIIDILIDDFEFASLESQSYNVLIKEVTGVTASPDQEYKNPEEIASLIERFADKFPEITSRVSIGKSLEGRDIWAIKISDNPEDHEVSEPAILFNSMHHAREVMTPEVSLDIIETLLNGYQSHAEIKKWIDSYQIWVIPMFNVDGSNKMWGSNKWWRKNTRGGYGVDLNRNYPSGWNKCNGSSGEKSSQTYRGPRPASEPETQAMMKFISKIRPVFNISYHSYSELVIYPLGCSPERTNNKDVVEKIGKEIAKKLGYTPGTAWELLYSVDGGDIDWMYQQYQVIPYVIEINSRKEGFHPRFSKWRDKTVKLNQAGWMHLLTRLGESGVRGQIRSNGAPVADFQIDIYKSPSNQISKKRLVQTYRVDKNGIFHLILNPGTYDLTFKNSSQSIVSKRVVIKNTLVELNVEL